MTISNAGFDVVGYDVNPAVKEYLTKRETPYREEDLQPLLDRHRVEWRDSIREVVEDAGLIFVAVQTPHEPQFEGVTPLPDERRDFDYTYLVDAVRAVASASAELGERRTLAVISTCLPGTFNQFIKPLLNEYIDYVYCPLFIAMGTVVRDYLLPEFNLIGVESEDAADLLEAFYTHINDAPPVRTDVTTAEGIKVSYNTWITAKTVIANAWGELCERVGMNFDDMFKAWTLAERRLISPAYMSAGMSDGGGCHPRDNIALSWLADDVGMSFNLWEALMASREAYEKWHADVVIEAVEEHELPVVLLGRAFKPETDIETGSPAMLMAELLRLEGVQFLHVNDAIPNQRAIYFIATQNDRYRHYQFAPGSVVIDPFGYIPDQEGVIVRRLGRR
ncbi:UDP-glucose 6-dehydrogenase [Mycolicibacterium phlei]|nr:UDP-glucose 6-dehydrogenase [Mycolicibacterium phlei]